MRYMVSALILVLLLFTNVGCNKANDEESGLVKENALLKDSINFLKQEVSALDKDRNHLCDSIKVLREVLVASEYSIEYLHSVQSLTYWFDEQDVDALKEKGVKDPRKDILASLYKDKDLVAEDGILGGTMSLGQGTLLRDCWAIAEGNDGHIIKNYLLKYRVGKDKSITWIVIAKSAE